MRLDDLDGALRVDVTKRIVQQLLYGPAYLTTSMHDNLLTRGVLLRANVGPVHESSNGLTSMLEEMGRFGIVEIIRTDSTTNRHGSPTPPRNAAWAVLLINDAARTQALEWAATGALKHGCALRACIATALRTARSAPAASRPPPPPPATNGGGQGCTGGKRHPRKKRLSSGSHRAEQSKPTPQSGCADASGAAKPTAMDVPHGENLAGASSPPARNASEASSATVDETTNAEKPAPRKHKKFWSTASMRTAASSRARLGRKSAAARQQQRSGRVNSGKNNNTAAANAAKGAMRSGQTKQSAEHKSAAAAQQQYCGDVHTSNARNGAGVAADASTHKSPNENRGTKSQQRHRGGHAESDNARKTVGATAGAAGLCANNTHKADDQGPTQHNTSPGERSGSLHPAPRVVWLRQGQHRDRGRSVGSPTSMMDASDAGSAHAPASIIVLSVRDILRHKRSRTLLYMRTAAEDVPAMLLKAMHTNDGSACTVRPMHLARLGTTAYVLSLASDTDARVIHGSLARLGQSEGMHVTTAPWLERSEYQQKRRRASGSGGVELPARLAQQAADLRAALAAQPMPHQPGSPMDGTRHFRKPRA